MRSFGVACRSRPIRLKSDHCTTSPSVVHARRFSVSTARTSFCSNSPRSGAQVLERRYKPGVHFGCLRVLRRHVAMASATGRCGPGVVTCSASALGQCSVAEKLGPKPETVRRSIGVKTTQELSAADVRRSRDIGVLCRAWTQRRCCSTGHTHRVRGSHTRCTTQALRASVQGGRCAR